MGVVDVLVIILPTVHDVEVEIKRKLKLFCAHFFAIQYYTVLVHTSRCGLLAYIAWEGLCGYWHCDYIAWEGHRPRELYICRSSARNLGVAQRSPCNNLFVAMFLISWSRAMM